LGDRGALHAEDVPERRDGDSVAFCHIWCRDLVEGNSEKTDADNAIVCWNCAGQRIRLLLRYLRASKIRDRTNQLDGLKRSRREEIEVDALAMPEAECQRRPPVKHEVLRGGGQPRPDL